MLTITKMKRGDNRRKINLVGFTGAGKTHQYRYLHAAGIKTLVVSSENKLTTIDDLEPDVITLKTFEFPRYPSEWQAAVADLDNASDLVQLCKLLKDGKHGYDVVFVDSGMRIADEIARYYVNNTLSKEGKVDTLRGFGEFADRIDSFFDKLLTYTNPDTTPQPVHIVVTWGAEWTDNGDGRKLLGPIVEGKKFSPRLPYKFSDIIYLYSDKDGDGNMARFAGLAQTDRYYAKVESGAIVLPPVVKDFNLATFLARLGGGGAKA